MRTRRRHNDKRQDGLVLQPGGAFLIDPVQAQSEGSVSILNTDTPLSQESIVQKFQAATGSVTNAEVTSIVFGPNLGASMVALTSAIGVTTTSSTSSSGTTTLIPTADSNSTSGSSVAFPTNAPSSIDSTNSTFTTSSTSPSAPFVPSIHLAKHTPTFIAAMAFLGIAVAACIIASIAYVLRVRHRQSSWNLGPCRDRDMDRDERNSGFSLFFEKPNTTFDTPKHSNTSLANQASYAIPALHHSFTHSPGGRYPNTSKTTEPYPISSVESLQAPGQVLGPLQVKNYMKGDFTSSCDESSPHSPARNGTPMTGTPRNFKPPFLSLDGKGLSMPWSEASPAADSCQVYTPTVAVKDSIADVEGLQRIDQDLLVPSLPTPPFDFDTGPSPVNEASHTDSWGTALRTSILSAFSGFSVTQPKPEDKDKYTAFAASGSRSSKRWRNAMASRRASAIAREAASNETHDLWSSPKTIDHGLVFDQPVSVVSKSAPSKQELIIEDDATSGMHSISISPPVPPLVVRKKFPLPATKSKRKLRCESVKSRAIASRASSIYSPCPDSVKTSQHMLARGPIVSQAQPSILAGSGLRGTMESAMSRSLTSSTRPPFLRQPTTSSVCSFSSEASEMSAVELHVKKTLALRARRKRGMDMCSPFSRASPAAQNDITAERSEVTGSDD